MLTGKDQLTTVNSMGGGTGHYGAPQLVTQLVGKATADVQGSSSNDTAAAVLDEEVLVQHYTKPNQSLV